MRILECEQRELICYVFEVEVPQVGILLTRIDKNQAYIVNVQIQVSMQVRMNSFYAISIKVWDSLIECG